jgi:hypothetical protein
VYIDRASLRTQLTGQTRPQKPVGQQIFGAIEEAFGQKPPG